MAREGALHPRRRAHRVDVGLYLALLASLVVALVSPSAGDSLVATGAIVPIIALLVLLGLRDKVVFLAARSEQYLPALVFFAFFPFVDMIVAAKLLIVLVWWARRSRSSAGTSTT